MVIACSGTPIDPTGSDEVRDPHEPKLFVACTARTPVSTTRLRELYETRTG